jgi:hypothetical protein
MLTRKYLRNYQLISGIVGFDRATRPRDALTCFSRPINTPTGRCAGEIGET